MRETTPAETRGLFTSGDDALITTSRDNVILSWSAGAAKLTGYRAHEVIGKNIAFLFPDKHREVDQLNLGDALGGVTVRNSVVKALSRNGDYVSIIYTLTPITDPSGQVVGVLRVCKNISAFRAARVALEKALVQLKRVDEVCDDVLSAVSVASTGVGTPSTIAAEEGLRTHYDFLQILEDECGSLGQLLDLIRDEISRRSPELS